MKAAIFTLGCKVNQQETAAMINILKDNFVDFSSLQVSNFLEMG